MKRYFARKMQQFIFLISLLLVVFPLQGFAGITAQVTPEKVQEGETFRLILTSDEPQSSGIPDLTPLQKEFRILSTERTISYTVINGQARSLSQWTLHLMAKKAGTLSIPAIKIGQQHSEPARVEITKETQAEKKNDTQHAVEEGVMLKSDVDAKQPYLSQQVLLSVKLYNSGRLLDAEYQPPTVENALLLPLGDADRYQAVENGHNYVVEEQQYAIFPQKSGKVRINGPSFHALVYDAVPRSVNLRPQTIILNVKPIPDKFANKPWLPAKDVRLSQRYEGDTKSVKQGETLTRSVIIEATGIPAQLLPTLAFNDGQSFSVYPEKPQEQNRIRNQELIGKRTTQVTYLMNAPGQVTLPEIQLPWYNTQTGQEEVAKLPPLTLEVLPGQQTASQQTPTAKTDEKKADERPTDVVQTPSQPPSSNLSWYLAIGFAIAWLITLMIWWFGPNLTPKSSKRVAIKQLHEACIHNDPHKARKALLRWAAVHWPDKAILDLNDLANLIHDPKLKRQLNRLSQVLYSSAEERTWQGSDLWLSVADFRKKQASSKNKANGLPPINP